MGSGGQQSQERRKAATRKRILDAADVLFDEHGYTETSIEDISRAADVAVRTIYLHFPSKAAIMLAYFDGWMDAFLAEILKRPVDEPVIAAVGAALRGMSVAGWVERVEGTGRSVHPLVEQLDAGSPDIAGHVLQRWMRALGELASDAVARGDDPLQAHARAIAVFAAWLATMSAARSKQLGVELPAGSTGSSIGLGILTRLLGGSV